MSWRDNPVGIVVDGSMAVDFAAAAKWGVSFAIVYCGLGYDQKNERWPAQVHQAYDTGIPIVAKYTPLPAIDDYTQPAVPQVQIPWLKKLITNKKFYGLIIDVTRYWTGFDIETGHPVRTATGSNINYVASEFVNTMAKELGPKNIQILVGSNDNFVQTYAPEMAAWLDKWGFDLVDNRYRLQAADGSWTRYITYGDTPVLKNTLEELRLSLPPIEAKNPLVPGDAPQLRFWECSGKRFALPFVKDLKGASKAVTIALWNGTVDSLHSWLAFTPGIPQEGDTTPPTKPGPITATAGPHAITLTWSAATDNIGIEHYTLLRNDAVLFDGIHATSITDDTIFPSTMYVYSIRAVDTSGNVSALSDLCSVSAPADEQPPDVGGDLQQVLDLLKAQQVDLRALSNKVDTLDAKVNRIGTHFT
jgi:hypothetical protein